MKKSLIAMATVAALALPSMCMAGANGNALNKAEKAADSFISALQAKATYTQLAPNMNYQLKAKVKEAQLTALQKQVKARFGNMKDAKFYSFERFDQGDKLVYIASFSKEKLASLVMVMDKKGKMTDFALAPMKAPATKAPATKKR